MEKTKSNLEMGVSPKKETITAGSKQVLNPQKGVSGPHSFKLIYTYIAPAVTSWRSESRNIGLVVLDKLLFGFSTS